MIGVLVVLLMSDGMLLCAVAGLLSLRERLLWCTSTVMGVALIPVTIQRSKKSVSIAAIFGVRRCSHRACKQVHLR